MGMRQELSEGSFCRFSVLGVRHATDQRHQLGAHLVTDGFWSDTVNLPPDLDVDNPAPGDIRDYRIGVRWRMLLPGDATFSPGAPPSCWDFDERDWNVAGGYAPAAACSWGDCVSHTYETSSWCKPPNGPRFDYAAEGCARVPSGPGEWTNPAYQVRVPTYWVAEWADEWYAWEQTGWDSPAGCFYSAEPPLGVGADPCSGGDHAGEEHWYQIAEPRYEWVHHLVGWYPIDLRRFGGRTWWYESWAVITTGSGEWCAYEYADPNPGGAVRVPVIEVQSIIVDPCRLDGTCGDLNPPWGQPACPGAPAPAPPEGGGGGDGEPVDKPGCGMCP